MKTAIVFLRVSKYEQIHKRQVDEITEYANRNNIQIKEWIKKKVSGSKVKSYKDEILNTALKHQVDYVIFQEVSRIGRKVNETTDLKEKCHNNKIGFLITSQNINTMPDGINVDPTQNLMVNQQLAYAENWAAMHALRVRGGQKANGNKGGRPKGSKERNLLLKKKNKKIVDYLLLGNLTTIDQISRALETSPTQVMRIKKLAIAEGKIKK
jgi:DNA invertase Pin-like site-specific DNA recombinase